MAEGGDAVQEYKSSQNWDCEQQPEDCGSLVSTSASQKSIQQTQRSPKQDLRSEDASSANTVWAQAHLTFLESLSLGISHSIRTEIRNGFLALTKALNELTQTPQSEIYEAEKTEPAGDEEQLRSLGGIPKQEEENFKGNPATSCDTEPEDQREINYRSVEADSFIDEDNLGQISCDICFESDKEKSTMPLQCQYEYPCFEVFRGFHLFKDRAQNSYCLHVHLYQVDSSALLAGLRTAWFEYDKMDNVEVQLITIMKKDCEGYVYAIEIDQLRAECNEEGNMIDRRSPQQTFETWGLPEIRKEVSEVKCPKDEPDHQGFEDEEVHGPPEVQGWRCCNSNKLDQYLSSCMLKQRKLLYYLCGRAENISPENVTISGPVG